MITERIGLGSVGVIFHFFSSSLCLKGCVNFLFDTCFFLFAFSFPTEGEKRVDGILRAVFPNLEIGLCGGISTHHSHSIVYSKFSNNLFTKSSQFPITVAGP